MRTLFTGTRLFAACAFILFAGVTVAEEAGGIEVKLTVPDSAWKLQVVEVREVKGELWVLSKVSRAEDAIGLQVITELKQTVPVDPQGRVVRHYVLGKTWNWENGEGYRFILSEPEHKEFQKVFLMGRRLHPEDQK